MIQTSLFPSEPVSHKASDLSCPNGYSGFSAFHKYWGKKPVEYLSFLIETLTSENDIVLDPFLGSGLIAKEAVLRKRCFIGIDINPVSIEMASLLLAPPDVFEYARALKDAEKEIRPLIDASYLLGDGSTASHFLWDQGKLISIWKANGRGKREELLPTDHDLRILSKFDGYKTKALREPRFFQNSRINAYPNLQFNDLFTNRALRNMDILIEWINKQPEKVRRALLLSLTSASGQMSNMVFAITGRGKTNGYKSDKIEVGSWVVGFWRPKLHFEINVWNCFSSRSNKLLKALKQDRSSIDVHISNNPSKVNNSSNEVALVKSDARKALRKISKGTVKLIITDPPHSDRIPYLELSEIWNSILGESANFEDEIVVSNAVERRKNKRLYNDEMTDFLKAAADVLSTSGSLAIFFNARDKDSWEYLRNVQQIVKDIIYRGCFLMNYSAGSVIQDNRQGAMKRDYVLIFQRNDCTKDSLESLSSIESWTSEFPSLRGE